MENGITETQPGEPEWKLETLTHPSTGVPRERRTGIMEGEGHE